MCLDVENVCVCVFAFYERQVQPKCERRRLYFTIRVCVGASHATSSVETFLGEHGAKHSCMTWGVFSTQNVNLD